jgi:hypothetical protein
MIDAREEHKNKLLGLEPSISYIKQKSKMNVKGIFRNLELYIPFDASEEFSRVTSISLSTQISYKTEELKEIKMQEINEVKKILDEVSLKA